MKYLIHFKSQTILKAYKNSHNNLGLKKKMIKLIAHHLIYVQIKIEKPLETSSVKSNKSVEKDLFKTIWKKVLQSKMKASLEYRKMNIYKDP